MSHPAYSQKIEDLQFDNYRRSLNDGEFETGNLLGLEQPRTVEFALLN